MPTPVWYSRICPASPTQLRFERWNPECRDLWIAYSEDSPSQNHTGWSALRSQLLSYRERFVEEWPAIRRECSGPEKISHFNEGLEPGQRLIPLFGDEIQIFLDSFNRPRTEFKQV